MWAFRQVRLEFSPRFPLVYPHCREKELYQFLLTRPPFTVSFRDRLSAAEILRVCHHLLVRISDI